MTQEILEFYAEFFQSINKDIKTESQFFEVLEYFDWNHERDDIYELKTQNVPDELKDKFMELAENLSLYTDGYQSNGYVTADVAENIYDSCYSLACQYGDEDEYDEFDSSGDLYWIEPDCHEYEPTEFKDPLTFDEIKKIFELSNQDIIDIQKVLDNEYDNPVKLVAD